MIQKDFFRLAFLLLKTHRLEVGFSFVFFFLIVFLVASVLFLASSLRYSELIGVENEYEILIQNQKGGQKAPIEDFKIDEALRIKGITQAIPRIYGEYYFDQANRSFEVVGVDFFAPNFQKYLDTLSDTKIALSNENVVFIGKGLQKELETFEYREDLTLYSYSGDPVKFQIVVIDDSAFEHYFAGMLVCDATMAREILGLEPFVYSDFYLDVPNSSEVPNIITHLKTLFPHAHITTKEERKEAIYNSYYYKGGVFLSLFLFAIVAYMILLYQKTILSIASEKKEIGVLRALGYTISDTIRLKIVQNLTIALGGFASGIVIAYLFVFVFQAPLLRGIFLGDVATIMVGDFVPMVEFSQLVILFLLTVVPYMASVLYPTWKIATIDPNEVIR